MREEVLVDHVLLKALDEVFFKLLTVLLGFELQGGVLLVKSVHR